MTEIEKLAEQAGFTVLRAQGLKESVPPDVFAGGHILINTEVKKFAELIVKECSNMCYKASQESFRLNEVKAGAMGMALKVLMEAHFGVEKRGKNE